MTICVTRLLRRSSWVALAMVTALMWTETAQARVKRIIVEKKVSPAFEGAPFGGAGQYETLAGRAFGELDPNDPHNAIITDIQLAPKNASGKVEYVASFFLVKPVDMSRSSRLMWHDVPPPEPSASQRAMYARRSRSATRITKDTSRP